MQNLIINLDQFYNLITAFFDCIWNKRTNYKLVRALSYVPLYAFVMGKVPNPLLNSFLSSVCIDKYNLIP